MDISNDKVIHVKKDNCEYLQFKKLLEYDGIIKHAYGLKPANYKTMGEGVTSESYENAINNYKMLCDSIGADYNKLIKGEQKHTNNVKCVEFLENSISCEEEGYKNTDGLVTNKSGAVLATTNADCILLILFDPVEKVIANIHSGWRGTFQKIAINAVNSMVDNYGCNPKNIICCICPSIRKCHFEVEEEVKNMCSNIFEYTGQLDKIVDYIGNKDGKAKWKIDTVLINTIMLKDCGLLEENIIDCGICSVCNHEYVHSYRVEGKGYGLSSAIISLA